MSSPSSRRSFLAGAALTVTLLAAMCLAPVSLLERLTSKSFPVHSPMETEGAVFITGCSSGIGRDAALSLAKEGYHVFCTVRKEKDATNLKHADSSNLVHPLICDVTNASKIQDASHQVSSWLEQSPTNDKQRRVLVGIVNNAGVTSELEMLEHVSTETLEFVWDVNLRGPLLVYQAFLPLLRVHGGRIVNVGSLAGQAARPFRGTYTISKFALEGLSDTLRQELLLENISVSMVNPGYIRTDIGAKNMEATAKKYGDADERSDLNEWQKELLKAFQVSYERNLETAGTTEGTTNAIRHALLSEQPRTRYYPGTMGVGSLKAWVVPKLKMFLPDRVSDNMIVKITAK